jgi:hypothetical protein
VNGCADAQVLEGRPAVSAGCAAAQMLEGRPAVGAGRGCADAGGPPRRGRRARGCADNVDLNPSSLFPVPLSEGYNVYTH